MEQNLQITLAGRALTHPFDPVQARAYLARMRSVTAASLDVKGPGASLREPQYMAVFGAWNDLAMFMRTLHMPNAALLPYRRAIESWFGEDYEHMMGLATPASYARLQREMLPVIQRAGVRVEPGQLSIAYCRVLLGARDVLDGNNPPVPLGSHVWNFDPPGEMPWRQRAWRVEKGTTRVKILPSVYDHLVILGEVLGAIDDTRLEDFVRQCFGDVVRRNAAFMELLGWTFRGQSELAALAREGRSLLSASERSALALTAAARQQNDALLYALRPELVALAITGNEYALSAAWGAVANSIGTPVAPRFGHDVFYHAKPSLTSSMTVTPYPMLVAEGEAGSRPAVTVDVRRTGPSLFDVAMGNLPRKGVKAAGEAGKLALSRGERIGLAIGMAASFASAGMLGWWAGRAMERREAARQMRAPSSRKSSRTGNGRGT